MTPWGDTLSWEDRMIGHRPVANCFTNLRWLEQATLLQENALLNELINHFDLSQESTLPESSDRDTPTDDLNLPLWSGLPFDPKNQACFLETGTLFCMIGDPHDTEAVLVIDAAHVEFVAEGASVEIKLDEYPTATLTGRIEDVAQLDMQVIPRGLSHKTGGGVETITDDAGVERTLRVSYQARVRLAEFTQPLLPGFRGRAIIHAGSQSLGQRLWRLANDTFRFR
jgi:hypothetical protein